MFTLINLYFIQNNFQSMLHLHFIVHVFFWNLRLKFSWWFLCDYKKILGIKIFIILIIIDSSLFNK
jgi:hypothetical protein